MYRNASTDYQFGHTANIIDQYCSQKIQVPALINFFLAIVGIIGSVVLFKTTTLGYYAVAISYVITLTIKNSIFIPWYATIILNKPRYLFLKLI